MGQIALALERGELGAHGRGPHRSPRPRRSRPSRRLAGLEVGADDEVENPLLALGEHGCDSRIGPVIDPLHPPRRPPGALDDGAADHLAGAPCPRSGARGDRWRAGRARRARWAHDRLRLPVDRAARPAAAGGRLGPDPGRARLHPGVLRLSRPPRRLLAAGAEAVFGLSTQDTAYQRELAERLALPFRSSPTTAGAHRGAAAADVRGRRQDAPQAPDPAHRARDRSSASGTRSSRRTRTPPRSWRICRLNSGEARLAPPWAARENRPAGIARARPRRCG